MIHSKTVKGFGGTYVHQDSDRNIIGNSKPNPFLPKEVFHYNRYNEMCGHSTPEFGGGYIHYDADNNIVGKSVKNPLGGYVHYDAEGNLAGRSEMAFGGDYINHDIKIALIK